MKKQQNLSLFMATLIGWSGAALAEGNRYDFERYYHSEISSPEAYYKAIYTRPTAYEGDHRIQFAAATPQPIIIDVRDVTEYAAGHPDYALSIPYPYILGRTDDPGFIGQSPEAFVAAVEAAIPDRSTPIYTLCRTGSRSVSAANLLAEAGYTEVRNVWEGFVGRYKQDVDGNDLDLNNNGELDDGDLDGWANFQAMPYTTELDPALLYAPYASLYYQE